MRRVVLATLGTVVGVILLLSLKPHHAARLAALPLSPDPSPSGHHGKAPGARKSGNAGGESGKSSAARLAALPLSPDPSPSGHGEAPGARKSGNAGGESGKSSAAPARRTVTGGTVTTPYGPVQVKVSLDGKKIVGIKAVQVPTDGERSLRIAEFAVPRLTHEALSVQSAQIDAVSGASYTSQGYMQSLQSALDRAGV